MNTLLGRAPTDADVVLGIHQFDLFQLEVAYTANMRGDDRLRSFAKAQSAAAEGRDDMLASISRRVGLDLAFPDQPDMPEADRLAGLQGSVGQTYVRDFYQDEVSECDKAISLLRRYLTKPDNADVKALSEKLLPELQASLRQAADRL